MRGIIRRIKKRNLKRQIDRLLKQPAFEGRNARLRSMGVIVDEEARTDQELFYELGKRLGVHRKDIRVLGYIAEVGKTPTMRSNVVHNSDFNWKAELQQDEAMTFLERSFDLLICYYDGKNPYLDLMTLMSRSPFKVGFAAGDARLYDMTVAVPIEKGKVFINEVVRYMEVLDKINPRSAGHFIRT